MFMFISGIIRVNASQRIFSASETYTDPKWQTIYARQEFHIKH